MPVPTALYARRRAVNKIALAISVGAAAFGLMWLVWILATLVFRFLEKRFSIAR